MQRRRSHAQFIQDYFDLCFVKWEHLERPVFGIRLGLREKSFPSLSGPYHNELQGQLSLQGPYLHKIDSWFTDNEFFIKVQHIAPSLAFH